ncbi:MAG TPA: amidohydrolase family protein, partial [Trueperaceae bacterium]
MDLILREGRLVDRDGTWDVGIAGGRIAQIAPRIAGRGEKELEVGGRLISPAFVEPHIHLDKAFLIDIAGFNEQGTLAEALRLTRAVKPRYTAEDVRRRAARAVQLYAALGTTAIRAHIDVDGTGGLLPLRAVLEVREQFREDVDLQIVAFPHQATLKDPDAYDLLVEALDLGADVLGGFPDVELSPEHGRRHLDQMLALARDRGVPLDVHIDEADDPGLRFLEYLAARTIEEGMTGRVTASHACAL